MMRTVFTPTATQTNKQNLLLNYYKNRITALTKHASLPILNQKVFPAKIKYDNYPTLIMFITMI